MATMIRCETCHGHGEAPTGHSTLYGAAYTTCPTCLGSGKDVHFDCPSCMDTGILDVSDGDPVPCPECAVLYAPTGPDPEREAYETHMERMADLDTYTEATALAEIAGLDLTEPKGYIESMP